MKSRIGKNIDVEIFGGSHEECVGVRLNKFPVPLQDIDMDALQKFLDRRAPGSSPFVSARREPDTIERACDNPPTYIIRNKDVKSEDYAKVRTVPRPGHADYTARLRYGDELNMAGGGPFSARMTAPLCIAGGMALQYLESRGIVIDAHILSIGDVWDEAFDPLQPQVKMAHGDLPALHDLAADKMKTALIKAQSENDSLGGIIEVAAVGLPAGIGGAMYDGLESLLSPIYFGIPAVKALEFGAGFAAASMRGSACNDPFVTDGHTITTKTNNAGGLLGGITTGMPLIARLAFKPTPSIAKTQESVDLSTMQNCTLDICGRHDPCVAIRAIPVVIAATALGILDALSEPETL